MEIFLLLLLGGLTAGLGLLATRGGKAAPPEFPEGSGPRSSPELPETPEEKDDSGKAVIIGESARQLKDFLEHAPAQIEARPVAKDAKNKLPDLKGKKRKPLKVTYSTDHIIGRASRFAHHRRALMNAEALVEKEKANEATGI